jgi:hypothetical protein
MACGGQAVGRDLVKGHPVTLVVLGGDQQHRPVDALDRDDRVRSRVQVPGVGHGPAQGDRVAGG